MLAGRPANAKTENLMLAGHPANAKTENLMFAGRPASTSQNDFGRLGAVVDPLSALSIRRTHIGSRVSPAERGESETGWGRSLPYTMHPAAYFISPFREHYPHPRAFVSCIKL